MTTDDARRAAIMYPKKVTPGGRPPGAHNRPNRGGSDPVRRE